MNFEDAFARLNGRSPTVEEVREALAIDDIVRTSNLDPVLLMFIASAKAKEEREAFANNVRSAAADAITTIRDGLPTSEEWRKAAAWAGWFAKALESTSRIATTWVAVIGAAIAIIAIVIATFAWRSGYGSGYQTSQGEKWIPYTAYVCRHLQKLRGEAAAQHHDDAKRFITRDIGALECP